MTGDGRDAEPFRGYLQGLVRADIRKQRAKVAGFTAKPGQDVAEAAAVLLSFRARLALAEGAYTALGGDPARITPPMRGAAPDPVTALLEEHAGPGLVVTVFTAAEAIAEDQPVYPVGDTEVKGAAGTGWSYGFALHDAAAGQLLAVAPPLEEDPESALPPAGWHLECPECEHTGGGHGPRCEGTAIPRRDGNPVSAAQAVRDYRASPPCGQCGTARTKHSFADHQWRATAPRRQET